MKNKDINYSAKNETPVMDKNLLSKTEWFNLKNKVIWGTANFAERNRYNMIIKSLESGNKEN